MTIAAAQPALSAGQSRFLRYWGLNMSMVYSWGWAWTPGFSYTDDEKKRFAELSQTVSAGATSIWMAAVVILFLLIGAVAMTVMIVIASLAWPDPSKTPAIAFVSLLALTCFLTLGFGFPLSMVWGGTIADWFAGGAAPAEAPGDAALHAKIRGQLWRLIAVMCVILIPGTMAFIVFNIDAGPVLTVLKTAIGLCWVVGIGSYILSRRARSG